MGANAVNILLEDVREMKKKLEEMEIELLKLKANMLEEEEISKEKATETLQRAKELYESGRGLTIGEFKKELGL